jgi:NTE family protein
VCVSVRDEIGSAKTAFVFAGGGSFGAIQVGMLHSLAAHGVAADMVVGCSVGALNGAFYAGDPTLDGVQRLATIWRGLQRHDVFPMSWRTVLSFLWHRDFLISHDGIRKLIEDHIPYRNLEEAKLPVHIVTTDIVSGDSVVLSEGSTAEAIVASTAIPGAFSPIRYKDYYLADGAISSNTPIQVAVKKGARRLIILPTGHACANQAPPVGAVANALHALTLLIARQLVNELETLAPATMPAGGLTLRFFANRRSYRSCHSLHRRLAGPARPAAGQDSARDAVAQPLSGGAGPLRCTAKGDRFVSTW